MRRKRLSKIAAVSLALSLCAGSFSACGKKDEEKSSDDLYTIMQEMQELEAGTFEVTIGLEAPQDDEKMELTLSGVTTEESFDIEVSADLDIDGMTVSGKMTQMVYEEEHLYINLADMMEFLNSMEEIGELSDFGIDSEYLDIYVGDIYEQTDNTAAGEMAELMLEMLEDAATSTDEDEGTGEDGSIEFKDEDVVAFMGNFAQSLKDNAEEFVDISLEASDVSYDYDEIFDYYGDTLSEYGIDMDSLKEELEAVEEVEITDEDKEATIEEIETACDNLIEQCEDSEDIDAKGSKFVMEVSLDGKEGSRTCEMNVDFLAATEAEGDEARIYMNYVFEEGDEKVEAPEESLELDALLEILAPLLETVEPEVTDPEIGLDEPTEGSADILNADGSYALGCEWGCEYSGRIDFNAPEGYTLSEEYSDLGFHAYDDADWNTLYLSINEGSSYLDNYSYTYTAEKGDMPQGTIATPVGEMAYIIDNTESYYTIYGFVTVDPEHYLEFEFTIYEGDEPTEEKLVEKLTNFAQGLKAAQ